MSESTSPPLDENARRGELLTRLVILTDDFYKFHQECAFLCDAFATVTHEPECISEETSEGIRHLSYWLKSQVKHYNQRIDDIYQEVRNHHIQAAANEAQE